jgi:hypothetical protein
MKKRLVALSVYAFFWLTLFILARLFFLISQFRESLQYSFGTLAATFWHGIRLDISVTGYFLLIPVLVSIPGIYFNGNWYRLFMRTYSYLFIIISSVITPFMQCFSSRGHGLL